MLRYVEYFIASIAVIFIVWQIILPLLKDQPILPVFNRRRREAEQKLAHANDEAEVAELEDRARRSATPTNPTTKSN